MKIQPLGDKVVLKQFEAETETKGGIIIPDTAKEKPQEGEIVAVGEGRLLQNGQVVPLKVKVGDKVLYGGYGHEKFTTKDGEELLIMSENEIFAIIK